MFALETMAAIIIALLLVIVLAHSLRIITVRVVTGKWPHESKESAELLDWMSRNT